MISRRSSSLLRSFKMLTLMAVLVWFTILESCIGRKSQHLRHNHESSVDLYDTLLDVKSHGNVQHNVHNHHHHHHHHKSKAKPKPKVKPPPKGNNGNSPVVPQPPPKVKPPQKVKPPCPSPPEKGSQGSKIFNVIDFGAKGDGKTDDTKAFEAAWAETCKIESSTMIVPPEYIFLVGPISFSGPYCQPNIVFQLNGTIIAPTDSKSWGKLGLMWWIDFSKLKGIKVEGNGVIDGRGFNWWLQDYPFVDAIDGDAKLIVPLNNSVQQQPPLPVRSELDGRMPSIKPTALRFYGSVEIEVSGIRIQNSPQCHLKFDNCVGVTVHNISVSSPGDSPNTDGIHLQNTKDVTIHTSTLACGDDCVSIQTGCSNVYIHNIKCGPGHGISIGSLGKDSTKACVSNITVRDIEMHNTMTGVRIKTWQGGLGSVKGILFSNIELKEVQLPIVIDQFYCDHSTCKNQTSAVAVEGVRYEKIRGTYTVKPIHFACSDDFPCVDVKLSVIELKPVQEKYHLYEPFCWQTFGELTTPTVPPIDCLQIGKPARNKVQSDHDVC